MRNSILRNCSVCFLALVMVLSLVAITPYATYAESTIEGQAIQLSAEEKEIADFKSEVIRLVNIERAKVKVNPLSSNEKLTEASDLRARECNQKFNHTRPDNTKWTTVYEKFSLVYKAAGENLAYGFKTPEAVVKAWMGSSGHKANILDPDFTNIGIGFYKNENGRIYCSQLFYTPK